MGKRKVSAKLLSNAFYVFLDWSFVTVFSFLFWLVLGKLLLPEDYGILALAFQLLFLLGTLSLFGIGLASSKLISEKLEEGKKSDVATILNLSFKRALMFSLLTSVASFLFFSFVFSFCIPRSLIPLISFTIPLASLSLLFGFFVYGFQKMRRFMLSDAIGHGLRIALTAVTVVLGFKYLGPWLATVVSLLTIILLRLDEELLGLMLLTRKKESKECKKLLTRYSSSAFVGTAFTQLFTNTHFIILGASVASKVTGLFAVAYKVSSVITVIPTILNQALFPITSQLSARRDKERQSELVSLVVRYSLLFSLPAIFILSCFSPTAILLFSREEYLEASVYLPLLSLSCLFWGVGNIFLSTLYAIKKPEEYRKVFFFVTILYLPSAMIATRFFSAIGLTMVYFLSTAFLLLASYFMLRKRLRICVKRKEVVKLIFATFLAFSPLLFLKFFYPKIMVGIVLALIGCAAYPFILAVLGFYERKDFIVLKTLEASLPSKVLRKLLRIFVKTLSHLQEKFPD